MHKNQQQKRTQQQECYMCKLRGPDHEQLLNNALYHKYSAESGVKMYRLLTCLVKNVPGRDLCRHKDQVYMDKEEQLLKKYEGMEESQDKLYTLVRYYQYHRSLPCCFIDRVHLLIEKHKHEHLKLYYINIKKQLNMTVKETESETSILHSQESETLVEDKTSHFLKNISIFRQSNLVQTESKALQDVYEDMKKLDFQGYLKEDLSCRRQFDSSKAFEEYLQELKEGKHVKKISKVEVMPVSVVQKPPVVAPYQNVSKINTFRKLIKDKLDFRDSKTKLKKPIEQNPMVIHRKSLIETPLIRRSSSVSSVMKLRRQSDLQVNAQTRSKIFSGMSFSLKKRLSIKPQDVFIRKRRLMSLQMLKSTALMEHSREKRNSLIKVPSNKIRNLLINKNKFSEISGKPQGRQEQRRPLRITTKEIYDRIRRI